LGIPVSSTKFKIPEHLEASTESEEATIAASVNPHSCSVAESDEDYLAYLREFDWVWCDGIGMVVAARRIAKINIDRTTFDLTSLAGPICGWLSGNRIPLVLVGGKPGVSARAAEKLVDLYPLLNIAGTFSGYGDDPHSAMAFLSTNPEMAIVCGMGAPRQEKFLIELKSTRWRGMGFGCGGFFDQIGEKTDYFPAWIDRLNLRFLYRLLREPRRLWHRYFIEYQVFLSRFVKEYFSQ
jgi:exopolysaccharide biosynthesis WecB/TagA/CpsF family protein